MDDLVVGALIVVRDHELSDPERYLLMVDDVYGEFEKSDDDHTLANFKVRLLERAAMEGVRDVAEDFVDYAEYNGGLETIRRLTAEGINNLLAVYTILRLEKEASDRGDDDEPADESDEQEGYDPDAWYRFLADYGPGWNGEEENWSAFREWFLYYADEQGLAVVATDFLDYAEGESDKAAFFAQYGIDVEAAEEALEDVAAAVRLRVETVAMASGVVAEEHVHVLSEAFVELVEILPEAATLSEDEIRQLIEEIAAEHGGGSTVPRAGGVAS